MRTQFQGGVIVEDDAMHQLYNTRKFTSEVSRKLNNFISHSGITEVIRI